MPTIFSKLEAIPQPVLFSFCLLSAAALGAADYLTGDLTLILFYFIPIAVATWCCGRIAGSVIALVCAVELFATDVLFQMSGGSIFSIRVWNSFMEAAFLLMTAQILYLLKVELEKNRLRAMELEAVNTELEAFSYTVAHDLRGPLTWIGGYSRLLLKRYGSNLEEQPRELLGKISEGSSKMQQLIDALLDFSHIGQGTVCREEVELSKMAHDIAAGLLSESAGRQVSFQITPGVTAMGDRRLLQVVLKNLLENAWKYSGERTDATIEFGATQAGEAQVFFVRDNGIGFAGEEAELLFVPFKRLAGSSGFHGHGIGLATVQRIIQRHGGRIWATGEVGNGATFSWVLS